MCFLLHLHSVVHMAIDVCLWRLASVVVNVGGVLLLFVLAPQFVFLLYHFDGALLRQQRLWFGLFLLVLVGRACC
jgi:hypothetical protein